MTEHLTTSPGVDVVVVGSGLAGLTAALALRPASVAILTKTAGLRGGSSMYAKGGVAAALSAQDSPARHAEDTLKVGGGIALKEAVEQLCADGPSAVQRLLDHGAALDRNADGSIALALEAAHSVPRVAHAGGDATGQELVRALVAHVEARGDIAIRPRTRVLDLVLEDGRVRGVIAQEADGAPTLVPCAAVVLATGGSGGLYAATTNPKESTGDGIAIAARAGAALGDLEFVQFHPTALAVGRDPMPLLTEALRGAGATITDAEGVRLSIDGDPRGELAPRDVVARALFRRIARGERVFLDARAAMRTGAEQRFPAALAACTEAGLDPRKDLLPISPAAHYHMGGVATDLHGRTTVPGLWVCGEAASVGMHGANRLASNSLLEAMVFGARVADDIARGFAERPPPRTPPAALPTLPSMAPKDDAAAEARFAEIRRLLWLHVGVVRDGKGLRTAIAGLRALAPECRDAATRDAVLTAELIASAALLRTESRGAHFRADHPTEDPALAVRFVRPAPVLRRLVDEA